MKPWWEMTEEDIEACLTATSWMFRQSFAQFRGGGYSSHFKTDAKAAYDGSCEPGRRRGTGVQIAEGKSITLPEDVHKKD